jgi:ABC-type glycerol-3-phosphate transport system permease component
MYTTYGLIDTYQGLVLMYTLMNLPYSVYLMKTLFDGVPYTIEEAAMIDGCSPLGVFRMAMRLAAAGLVVTFLFGLIFSWNEFFFALTLTRIHASTVPVKLASWYTPNTGNWWGPQAAQCLVASIPILVLFAFLQKWIVKGLTFGAVKG